MDLTADTFRALARSSPWRWRDLHLTRRDAGGGVVEAWVERPGRMRVVVDGREHRVDMDAGAGDPVVLTAVLVDGPAPGVAPGAPAVPRVPAVQPWAGDVEPVRRPDGLVAERPDTVTAHYEDPMWQSYDWVAMLDPAELDRGVEVDDLRAGHRRRRPTWTARPRPVEGYEPRCGCCPLLLSDVSMRDEYGEDWAPPADEPLPTTYDVSLDVATGVVVSLRPVDGVRAGSSFEVELHHD